MKIGVCTSIDHAAVAAEAGFDYVEGNVQNLLVPEQPDDMFAPFLKQMGCAPVPVTAANCFLPALLKCVGPGVDEERLNFYADAAFRRARQAGIRSIVFGSGAARQIPEGFPRDEARKQLLSFLRRIAPMAAARDVLLLIESLNRKECNFVNTLAEGAALVEEVGHPHFRLLADVYHMRMDGEAPEEIVKHGRWIQHVHVAEREGRQAPGTHGEDFGPYLRALKEIGYGGAISFECKWQDLPQQAKGSLASFREQVLRAGLL